MKRNSVATPSLLAILIWMFAVYSAHAQSNDVSDSLWSIVISAASLADVDMGLVPLGSAKDSLIVAYVRNTGSIAIYCDSVSVAGAGAAAFSVIAGTPPFWLPAGGQHAMEFRFRPVNAGTALASVIVHTVQADTLAGRIRGEGVLPQVEIIRNLVDFGQVQVGTDVDSTIIAVIRNTGLGILSVSGTRMTGPDNQQFSILSGGGAFMLPAGGSHAMQLRFSPSRTGRTSGSVTFDYSGPGSAAVVELFGEGLLPPVEVVSGLIDFGKVNTGTLRDTAVAVIRNRGLTDLSVSSIRMLGPDTSQFRILSGGGAFTLKSGDTRILQLRFSPMSDGGASGSIAFFHDGKFSPAIALLAGEGVSPKPEIVTARIDFGAVALGGHSDSTLMMVIRNAGSGNLSVVDTKVTGPDSSHFSILAGGNSFALSPGQGRAMRLRFAPIASGPSVASIHFTHNGSPSPSIVNLTGEGVRPNLEVITATVDFGRIRSGSLKDTAISVVIRNTGNGNVVISDTRQLGPDSIHFSILSGGGAFTLAPGAARAMQLRFAPSSAGRADDSLGFFHDDASTPALVHLTGEAIAPELVLVTPTVDFGSVRIGSAKDTSLAVILRNVGNDSAAITATRQMGPDTTHFSIVSGGAVFSIPPGGTRAMQLRFAPTDTGMVNGSIGVFHDGASLPLIVNLTAVGIVSRMELVTPAVDFGKVRTGSLRDTSLAIVLRNMGNGIASISETRHLGPDSGRFSILSGGGSFTLAPYETHAMRLRFAPIADGNALDSIAFFPEEGGPPSVMTVTGEGVAPTMSLLVQTIDFGAVRTGNTRDTTITAILRNTGSATLTVFDTRQLGPDTTQFSLLSGGGGFILAPGAVRAIRIRFAPVSSGTANGSLGFFGDDGQGPSICGLVGVGIAPRIEMDVTDVDFGRVTVGFSKDTTISSMIRNTGTADLIIVDTRQAGPDSSQFSILAGGGSFTLAPGEAHGMRLRFSPMMGGAANGSIGYYVDTASSPAIFQMLGEGMTVHAAATLHIDTVRAATGSIVEIPLLLRNPSNLGVSGASRFHAELRFNASLLIPMPGTPLGVVRDRQRIIALDSLPLYPDAQGAVARLSFRATLGDAEETSLILENAYAVGGTVAVTTISGNFILTDVCRDGGLRLIQTAGSIRLFQNRPNPFNARSVIEYEVVEYGLTQLFVTDITGRTVATLVDDLIRPGRYRVSFDASLLNSGTYAAILQTPTQRRVMFMEVVK